MLFASLSTQFTWTELITKFPRANFEPVYEDYCVLQSLQRVQKMTMFHFIIISGFFVLDLCSLQRLLSESFDDSIKGLDCYLNSSVAVVTFKFSFAGRFGFSKRNFSFHSKLHNAALLNGYSTFQSELFKAITEAEKRLKVTESSSFRTCQYPLF